MSPKYKSKVTVGLLLALPVLGQAQSYGSDGSDYDYEDYFGDEGGRANGPQSLDEARSQGRGYRVGTQGPGTNAPNEYIVRQGDTLWNITGQNLGDPWQWPQVWSYNPEITNPHWIYPQSRIRLRPPLATPAAEPVNQAAAVRGESVNVVVPLSEFTPGTVFLRDQGYLDEESLAAAGTVVGAAEETMLLSVNDEIYVEFAEGADARAGQQYAVFRRITPEERMPGEQGKLVRVFGTVVVRSYDPERRIARAVITEALDPIERGFKVAKVERRFDFVQPRRNAKDLVAKIIATAQQRDLIAEGVVVFVDAGQEQGVEPGNRFFVLRRGDEWRDSIRTSPTNMGSMVPGPRYRPDEYPDEAVAELRVVKVKNNVAIALVTRSNTDVAIGERVEMREGF